MSDDIIERAAQALAGISEGPYYVRVIDGSDDDYTAYVCRKYMGVEDVVAACLGDDTTPAKADAAFFAAAPELIRALIEELTRLRTWAQAAQGYVPPLDDDVSEEAKS